MLFRSRQKAEDLDGAGLEGTFDLVFAVDVLEHVDDLERTIAGIARVLAPGGGLGFLTHNRTIAGFLQVVWDEEYVQQDRKSTRLNSSHGYISYAVFCLKKKKRIEP